MKTKNFILSSVILATMLGATSCSLDQEPGGSTITQKQYDQMDNKLEGTVKGIYSLLYEYGAHDIFGLRSIDMYGDLTCGDMAMNSQNFGWFVNDEKGNAYQRTAYYWSFYYNIIRSCNKTINLIEMGGKPSIMFNPDTISDEMYAKGFYYAQMLTMRGWAYSNLLRYYTPAYDNGDGMGMLSVPIYTELDTRKDSTLGAPRAPLGDLYLRIEEDFNTAIGYFEAYNAMNRSSKIEMNVDLARIFLAYSYLNKGVFQLKAEGDDKTAFEHALTLIQDMFAKQTEGALILPNAEVLTDGFNNIGQSSWIWAEDVTVQNRTSLASFFGQVDIFSYSYAGGGDVKGIDENLLKEIRNNHPWDIRSGWFGRFAEQNPDYASVFEFAPDGKFYSNKMNNKTTLTFDDLNSDREWLSDVVFMRIELAYLIGAEAAWRAGDMNTAFNYLTAITDQRVKMDDDSKKAYEDYKAALKSDNAKLGEEIRYNWRVELWGEGYGLQTFRRWNKAVTLGANHIRPEKGMSYDPADANKQYTFQWVIPSSEENYNPYLRPQDKDTQNLQVKN